MLTGYDVNIPVMPQEQPSGGESKRQRLHWLGCMFAIFAFFSSCSVPTPKLLDFHLPQSYSENSGLLHQQTMDRMRYKSVFLNNDQALNKKVIGFWKRAAFHKIMKTEHPYLQVGRSDIGVLADALMRLFDIYYLTGWQDVKPFGSERVLNVSHSKRCQPLSNHEIRFMLNSRSENAFPLIPFTMLIVSSHELMLQKGGIPNYPKVLSSFLRKRFQLPRQKKTADANLFGEKSEGNFQIRQSAGFVFCRKTDAG